MTRVVVSILSLCLSFSAIAQQSLKVLSYNVTTDKLETEQLQEWIKTQTIQLAALQNLKIEDEKALKKMAKGWGHKYVVLLPTGKTAIALTSSRPIKNAKNTVLSYEAGHIYAEVEGFAIYATQLPQDSVGHRIENTDVLANQIRKQKQPVILLGNLQSYALSDSLLYNKRFRQIPKEARGDRTLIQSISSYQRKENYEVFRLLEEVGINDPLSDQRSEDAKTIESTYPTKALGETPNYKSFRYDYILTNTKAKSRCKSIEIIKDSTTDKLSNHYPVVANFELEK